MLRATLDARNSHRSLATGHGIEVELVVDWEVVSD